MKSAVNKILDDNVRMNKHINIESKFRFISTNSNKMLKQLYNLNNNKINKMNQTF